MHIIREHEESLVVAETRPDGSIKVKYYELREYVELSAEEWDSLSAARMRAIPVANAWRGKSCDRCGKRDETFNAVIEHSDCYHWLCETCEELNFGGCIVCFEQEVPHAPSA